jgi:hypothetical protein
MTKKKKLKDRLGCNYNQTDSKKKEKSRQIKLDTLAIQDENGFRAGCHETHQVLLSPSQTGRLLFSDCRLFISFFKKMRIPISMNDEKVTTRHCD